MFPLKDDVPTDRLPVVTIALIAVNVVVYVFWQRGGLTLGDPSSQHYICQLVGNAAVPRELTDPGFEIVGEGCGSGGLAPTWLTPFTAMFMHGGLLHLGGNMLFLWIFGSNVEDSMGRGRYLVFYLLAGVVALALQVALDPSSTVPTLGASGAVAGVLGGYIVLFPRARVLTFVFIVFFFLFLQLRAVVVLGLWFVLQAVSAYFDLAQPTSASTGGVAYAAHVGGFVFGLVLVRAFANRRKPAVRPQPSLY